jgi:hypothetical protein
MKADLKEHNEVPLIGAGFQNVIDSYFWYLPFASVRQCRYVMDKEDIPEDEWMTRRAALAEEHKMPGARDSLRAGFKEWLQPYLFKQRQSKSTGIRVPKSTQPAIVDED